MPSISNQPGLPPISGPQVPQKPNQTQPPAPAQGGEKPAQTQKEVPQPPKDQDGSNKELKKHEFPHEVHLCHSDGKGSGEITKCAAVITPKGQDKGSEIFQCSSKVDPSGKSPSEITQCAAKLENNEKLAPLENDPRLPHSHKHGPGLLEGNGKPGKGLEDIFKGPQQIAPLENDPRLSHSKDPGIFQCAYKPEPGKGGTGIFQCAAKPDPNGKGPEIFQCAYKGD